jgi:hypothetical protein
MTKPSITIYDHETGETVVREMNEIEYAEHLSITEQAQAEKAAREALATQKAAAKSLTIDKLISLGIDPSALGLEPEATTTDTVSP